MRNLNYTLVVAQIETGKNFAIGKNGRSLIFKNLLAIATTVRIFSKCSIRILVLSEQEKFRSVPRRFWRSSAASDTGTSLLSPSFEPAGTAVSATQQTLVLSTRHDLPLVVLSQAILCCTNTRNSVQHKKLPCFPLRPSSRSRLLHLRCRRSTLSPTMSPSRRRK